MNRIFALGMAIVCASAMLWPIATEAAPIAVTVTREDAWEFTAVLYGWYADIGGKTNFPNGHSADISVDASDLYSNLKFGALGSFEARKGLWGMFTDVIYMNVGQFNSQFHELSIGGVGLPADASSSTNFNMKSLIWTLAGSYRVLSQPDATLDTFAGARLFDTKVGVDWTLNGNIGQYPVPERAGSLSTQSDYIDGILGFKGRLAFGGDRKWFIPYYGDIGTGESKLTWQAMAGLGYAFQWGEVLASWRYLDYQFKSDSHSQSQNFNGPLLGVAFRW